MKDFAYCDTVECIHRRGCKRWIDFQRGDYDRCQWFVNYEDCMNSNFSALVRVKLSDGSEIKCD